MNTTTNTKASISYHIPQIQADPFTNYNQYNKEHAAHKNAIQELLAAFTVISFKTGNTMLVYHPSAKENGHFQITVFVNGLPLNDSQHDTKQDAGERIAEYDRLEVVEAIL